MCFYQDLNLLEVAIFWLFPQVIGVRFYLAEVGAGTQGWRGLGALGGARCSKVWSPLAPRGPLEVGIDSCHEPCSWELQCPGQRRSAEPCPEGGGHPGGLLASTHPAEHPMAGGEHPVHLGCVVRKAKCCLPVSERSGKTG